MLPAVLRDRLNPLPTVSAQRHLGVITAAAVTSIITTPPPGNSIVVPISATRAGARVTWPASAKSSKSAELSGETKRRCGASGAKGLCQARDVTIFCLLDVIDDVG